MIFLIENYELSEKTPRVKKFLKLVKECTSIFPTAVGTSKKKKKKKLLSIFVDLHDGDSWVK